MIKNDRIKSKNWRGTLIKIGLIILPLAVGGIASALTGGQMSDFMAFKKPLLSPPGWLFPIVWTILYILMGIASIYFFQKPKKTAKKSEKNTTVTLRWLYITQLILNFTWTIVFFGFDAFYAAFVILILLWMAILAMLILSYKNFHTSFWCLFPYILWISFAGYLNIMIAVLN